MQGSHKTTQITHLVDNCFFGIEIFFRLQIVFLFLKVPPHDIYPLHTVRFTLLVAPVQIASNDGPNFLRA